MATKKAHLSGHTVPDIQHAKPEVFILDNLHKDDESLKPPAT